MKTRKLSEAQRYVLDNIATGHAPGFGKSLERNATIATGNTLQSLRVHQLVSHTGAFNATWYITQAGRDALDSGRYTPKD